MLLIFFAAIMLLPLAVSFIYDGTPTWETPAGWRTWLDSVAQSLRLTDEQLGFVVAIVFSALAGFLIRILGRGASAKEVGIRDGFAVVSLAWAILAFFGALPFFLSGFP